MVWQANVGGELLREIEPQQGGDEMINGGDHAFRVAIR